MPVIINGTTGISGVDGTAASPAIEGGDTNTGMFFPAADTVAIATGGTERMRVDNSEVVVYGGGNQQIRSATTDTSGASVGILRAEYTGGGGGTASSIDVRAGDNYTFVTSVTNTPLLLGTNTTERFRIGGSGQLGIGGLNYGTSGQVFTSGGSGAAPSWADVGTAISGMAWDAVGSYAMARNGSVDVTPGSTTAGSNITGSNAGATTSGGVRSGTWRAMGFSDDSSSTARVTLWLRTV